MSAIASPEFVSLCQAQLQLLTQQMSESSAAVYITDMAGSDAAWAGRQHSEPNFIPVVSYPEPIDRWVENFARATAWAAKPGPKPLLPSREEIPSQLKEQDLQPDYPQVLQPDRQLVVPLVYADVVVGLMVAIRRDRSWDSEERHYIERVAQSLAAGCVMERRTQWLQSQIADKRDLQSRQSEIFHNLLHQFRNPLTAVTTFGQLLVRRLEPEDPNQKIATGIVRESKRLREMVAHFDETVAIGDADLARETTQRERNREIAGEISGAITREPGEMLSLPPSPRKLLPGGGTEALLPSSTDESEASVFVTGASDEGDQSPSDSGLGHPLSLCAQYLPDIVEPILAVASIVAMEKGVTIRSQVASDTPSVWGDEEALGEVVSNLVDNAVKYSPRGAQVWVQTGVSYTSQSHHYQGIVVGDTGPGIPPDDLARLFERHYRGVQAESDIPGTGLGLAIAQSLMTQMQGFIEVISPAVGTPWMPADHLKDGPDSALTSPKMDRETAPKMDLKIGPGTVFIVWLREAEAP